MQRAPGTHEKTEQELEHEVEAKIYTIAQWLGLALLGACTTEAIALIVHGQGSNGKSVLLDMISELFGGDRVATLAPQKMRERFSRQQLLGCALNCVSEMPESDLLDSSTLKAIISGDRIECEFKHLDAFTFKPRAAHVFSANHLPASRDRSHGLWRRLLPVEFTHIFTDDEKDRDMINKLKAEFDLIVPRALDCAREYYIERRFKYIKEINAWRWIWRRQVDHVALYVEERLQPTSSAREGAALKEIWEDFTQWATDTGASGAAKMSLIAFGRQVAQLPTIEKGRYGKQRTTRINQKLKTNTDVNAWQTTH